MGMYPGRKALTVTLRSPRAPVGGPLLKPERPAPVVAERANPLRKERRDRSEVMLIRSQQAHESSTNLQGVRSPDTEDNDRAKSTSQFHCRYLLKSEIIGASRLIPYVIMT